MLTNNYYSTGVPSYTGSPAEAEVKATNEHSCLSLFTPTFHKHTPVSHGTQSFVESRRIEVKKHITQLDYLFTQLYFLAHQHQAICISEEDRKLATVSIEASCSDENITSIIACLEQFTKSLPCEKQIKFSTIITSLRASLPIAFLISSLVGATEDIQSSIAEQLNVLLFQQYQHLPVGTQMLIPAGYFSGGLSDLTRKGHAVLLELTKLEEGKVTLRVFNTGEGLNYHKKKNAMFYPFIIENIEGSLIDRDFFAKLSALGCQKKHTKTNEIDDLYYLLAWKFRFQVRYHNPADSQYFDQGLANSCAHQCVMAWIKNSLGEGCVDLFDDFMNYLVHDRMKMMMEFTDKQKSDVYIKKPYVVYSFAVQKSLTLTLKSAANRLLFGSTIYEKIESAKIDQVTAYITEHFEKNLGFKTPRNEDYYLENSEPDSDSALLSVYKGQTSISFDELQKLRALDCLTVFLNEKELTKSLENKILSLNARDAEDLKCLKGINYLPYSVLKKRFIAGTLSLPELIKIKKECESDENFFKLSFNFKLLVLVRCLSIQGVNSLTEEQAKVLKLYSIIELIEDGNLDIQDALTLNETEARKIVKAYDYVRENIFSCQRAKTLTKDEQKILEIENIKEMLVSKKISLEEALSLKENEIEWIKQYYVFNLIESGHVDWKKVIQLDRSEADFFDKASVAIRYNRIVFDEYFNESHANYHLLPS